MDITNSIYDKILVNQMRKEQLEITLNESGVPIYPLFCEESLKFFSRCGTMLMGNYENLLLDN